MRVPQSEHYDGEHKFSPSRLTLDLHLSVASERRLLTSPTQEQYFSRKATIPPPPPNALIPLKLALFRDAAHFYLIKRGLPFKKAFLKCLQFSKQTGQKLLCNIHVLSSKRAKLPTFAWLRFNKCVPQFIPSLCRKNIFSFSNLWQLSRCYKSRESFPGDPKKVQIYPIPSSWAKICQNSPNPPLCPHTSPG